MTAEVAKEILTQKRADILGRRTDRPNVERLADPLDNALNLQDTYRTADDRTRDAAFLRQIDRALQAINDFEYGLCTDCDQPISKYRLDAVPWATLCIRCAERQESVA